MRPLTIVAEWLTKLIGMDDRNHHGVSFVKLIIGALTYCLCQAVTRNPVITWPVVFFVLVLVSAAMGRSEFRAVLEVLKAKWSGNANDSTSASATFDAAAVVKALPNLWRDDESGLAK